jgi:hypothetical protein
VNQFMIIIGYKKCNDLKSTMNDLKYLYEDAYIITEGFIEDKQILSFFPILLLIFKARKYEII